MTGSSGSTDEPVTEGHYQTGFPKDSFSPLPNDCFPDLKMFSQFLPNMKLLSVLKIHFYIKFSSH